MKIAIICDSLSGGGAQRVVLALAKTFNADVYTGYKSSNSKELKEVNIKCVLLKREFRPYSIFSFYLLNIFKNDFIKEYYDIYIFSGNHCISAVDKYKPNIWYCHSPSRMLYVERERILKEESFVRKINNTLCYWFLLKSDQIYVKKFDLIIANSNTTKLRIYKIYGKKTGEKVKIIYPPVNIEEFRWKGQGDYYLSTARLIASKRVDLIVKAFMKMPNKKLIIVSSGSQENYIRKIAQDYSNIIIYGLVSEKKLQSLIGNCIATIYIPFNEDFGISPLEGMAAGKPCIGVKEGGVKETVINKKTGYLCPKNPTVSNLIDAVNFMTPSVAIKMRTNCEKQVKLFSKAVFLKNMKNILSDM